MHGKQSMVCTVNSIFTSFEGSFQILLYIKVTVGRNRLSHLVR